MTIALNHEDEDYECQYAATPSACPYKGYKLVQKIRMEIEFSQEDKDGLRNLISFLDPSDELIEQILKDEDISAEYDKFCSYVNKAEHMQTVEKHIKRVDEMVHKMPPVELLKMKYFIRSMLKEKSMPDDEVLDTILSRKEILESMRIALGPDGDKVGGKHYSVVEEAIKTEMKLRKKKCVNCSVS